MQHYFLCLSRNRATCGDAATLFGDAAEFFSPLNVIIQVFLVLQDARKACSDSTLSQVRLT